MNKYNRFNQDLEVVFIIHSPAFWHNDSSCSTALIHRGLTSSSLDKHCSEPKPRPLLPKGTHLPSTHIYKHTINTTYEGPLSPPLGLTYEALFCEDNHLPAHAYRRFPLWFGQGHILHLKRNQSELWEKKWVKKSQSIYAHVVPVHIKVIKIQTNQNYSYIKLRNQSAKQYRGYTILLVYSFYLMLICV